MVKTSSCLCRIHPRTPTSFVVFDPLQIMSLHYLSCGLVYLGVKCLLMYICIQSLSLTLRHKMKHNYDKFGLKHFSEMNEWINNTIN